MVKFILIKSPDEWATTKQACRDELVVYLLFSPKKVTKQPRERLLDRQKWDLYPGHLHSIPAPWLLDRVQKISTSLVDFCEFNCFFQRALHTVRFQIKICQIYPKSSFPSEKSWSSERRLTFRRSPTCMCNRNQSFWGYDHPYGFSALSIFCHQASLPAASRRVLTCFFHAHASKCSVLNTAHTSLLGPHTTVSLSCLWFHCRFQVSLHFLIDPLHALLHLKIWWRLSL